MRIRLGRAIDRARVMLELQNHAAAEEHQQQELTMLWQRARILRTAITLSVLSALLAASLIIVLFISALLHLEIAIVVVMIFVGCLVAIIASLVYFIRDIEMSLHALKMEFAVRRMSTE